MRHPVSSCRRSGSRRGAVVLGASLALGCSADSPSTSAPAVSVRDSADVRIVEHGPGALAAAEKWALAEGGADVGGASGLAAAQPGGEAHELTRVLAAAVLPGDTIVVVDAGAGELRYFGPDGRHVRTVGRPGEGPGEFGALLMVSKLDATRIAYRNGSLPVVYELVDMSIYRACPGPKSSRRSEV